MAAEKGREVFAVPGSPLDPRSEGTNALLKEGATLVTEVEDVLSVIRPILDQPPPVMPADEPPAERPDGAEAIEEPESSDRARVVQLLGPTPVSIDDLVRLSGTSPTIVRMVLLELEIAGRLERHGNALVSLIG